MSWLRRCSPSQSRSVPSNLPIDSKYQFVVIGVDRRDGAILWKTVVREEVPLEAGHRTGSLASASPVTDGEFVFALFGAQGVYCLNLQGEVVWERNLGPMHTKHGHGHGASPALYGESLIVNWDHEDGSFLVVLDKRTGKNRCRNSCLREWDALCREQLRKEDSARNQPPRCPR